MSNKSKTINNINNKIKQLNKRLNNIKSNKRIMSSRKRATQRQRSAIPMAKTNNFTKKFYVDKLTATTARVSGSDLVYAIPNSLTSNGTTVITIIPCNPAYWLGTRVSAIAAGYQNYRPVSFNVHYVPQVAVTQQGNVIGGTLWYDAPPVANLQQTLRTSNGGMMTQCYKPSLSHVRLASNLQYNLYRMGGDIDQQSMPFFYIAITVACTNASNQQIVPGYFYVDYCFIFKNPTGPSTVYYNSGLTQYSSSTSTLKANSVAILCSELIAENATYNIGTILNVEYNMNDDTYDFDYNGSPVDTPAGYLWILSNGPNQSLSYQQMKASTKMSIHFDDEYTAASNDIEIPPYSAALVKDATKTFFETVVNNSFAAIEYPISVGNKYYLINDTAQNFGTLSSMIGDVVEFIGFDKDYYLIKTASAKIPKKLPLVNKINNNRNNNFVNNNTLVDNEINTIHELPSNQEEDEPKMTSI